MDENENDELSLPELLGWAEFCSWSALVMAPIIYWLQGESVSHDQFVVRTALVLLAAAGGIGLRCRAWRRRRPSQDQRNDRTRNGAR
jgi:hypothetical protein